MESMHVWKECIFAVHVRSPSALWIVMVAIGGRYYILCMPVLCTLKWFLVLLLREAERDCWDWLLLREMPKMFQYGSQDQLSTTEPVR